MPYEHYDYPLSTIGDRLEGLIDSYSRAAAQIEYNQKTRTTLENTLRFDNLNIPSQIARELKHQYFEHDRIYDEITHELRNGGYTNFYNGLMHECYLRPPTTAIPRHTVFIRRKKKHLDVTQDTFASALVASQDEAAHLCAMYCRALRTPHFNTKLKRDFALYAAELGTSIIAGFAAGFVPLYFIMLDEALGSPKDPAAKIAYWTAMPLIMYAAGRATYLFLDEIVGTGRFRRAVKAWNSSPYPRLMRHHRTLADPLWDPASHITQDR